MCNKVTIHSIESVGQAVGIKSDRRCRRITFGIDRGVQDSGAGKASSNTRVQMSLESGSRSTVLDGWQVCCVG